MFPEVDPLLGPEMRSTGEVLGLPIPLAAFFKAQEATQTPLPRKGPCCLLLPIGIRCRLEAVRLFKELGFKIMTTEGTDYFLEERGIENTPLRKLGYGRPDLVDAIKNGAVDLLVDTPSGRKGVQDSSNIRKAAIKYRVPYITTTAAAIAPPRASPPGVKACPRSDLYRIPH